MCNEAVSMIGHYPILTSQQKILDKARKFQQDCRTLLAGERQGLGLLELHICTSVFAIFSIYPLQAPAPGQRFLCFWLSSVSARLECWQRLYVYTDQSKDSTVEHLRPLIADIERISQSRNNMTLISMKKIDVNKSQAFYSALTRVLMAHSTENALAFVFDGLPTERYFRDCNGYVREDIKGRDEPSQASLELARRFCKTLLPESLRIDAEVRYVLEMGNFTLTEHRWFQAGTSISKCAENSFRVRSTPSRGSGCHDSQPRR